MKNLSATFTSQPTSNEQVRTRAEAALMLTASCAFTDARQRAPDRTFTPSEMAGFLLPTQMEDDRARKDPSDGGCAEPRDTR